MAQRISPLDLEESDKIVIYGKNLEVTLPLREHIMAKLKKIEEMTPPVIGVHVYLDIQREEHRVEIEYKFSHFRIVVTHAMVKKTQSKMDDMYYAIDMACDKLKRKVRRWKTRIQEHHGKKPFEIEEKAIQVLDRKTQDVDYINDQIEESTLQKIEEEFRPPMVVKEKKRQIPMLTMEEATMRIDLSNDNFLVYRGEEDQKIKVMYVRRDKTLGVIEIQ
jgi:putative sigma-54 modulation protein